MSAPSLDPAQAKSDNAPAAKKASTSKIFIDLFVCILIPTLILKKLSGTDDLGASGAFALAISLPLAMAIYEMITSKKVGFVSAIGFVSILLTGGIGLLKLPKEYIAYKEALIPSVFALAAFASTYTSKPLVRLFLYNDMLMNTGLVEQRLAERSRELEFADVMKKATLMLAASFVLSAVLNFILAKTIIVSETGTEAFNNELGTMNLLSYPVIVLPCMVVTFYAMYFVFKNIRQLTALELEEIVAQ